MTKSTKCVRIDANKGSKVNEYYEKIIHNWIRKSTNEYQGR